ncbi:non-classical arabinogalactan protein 31-like [Salvia hispanica]|uniref:non-classical arabinogalactan protein 31-like n=1 Tax=Salvia hispanica TaxID=49212 RepID=UPI0020092CF3|nr:non-classical arabinogalactan protein 31-like [Salvia hispanica]
MSTSSTAMASNDNAGKIPSLHPIHPHHCGGHHHHHHHHYFYVSPHCPLHRPILQPINHAPSCSLSTPAAPIASIPINPHLTTHPDQISDDAPIIDNEIENLEDENEEEEEDPIFVLTDEWREFFAKSEAKRKLAKKQAKKGKK